MILAYYLSKKFAIEYNLPSSLLVLGSGNLDEAIVGYYTKYDCSSADINPIASLTKVDLTQVLEFLGENRNYKSYIP